MRESEKEELIRMLVSAAFTSCADPRKPGIVVKRLLTRFGDKIRKLTSEDFRRLRPF